VTNRYKAVLVKISNLQDNYYKYQTSSFINSSIINIYPETKKVDTNFSSILWTNDSNIICRLVTENEIADRALPV
jgi:hypothetical protein